jgi:hypothetical protein
MLTTKLTPEIIAAAIGGFEAQKAQIDAQIAELRAAFTGGPIETAATVEPARKRGKMSAAARKRIADAQRKRWAESKKATEPSTPEVAPKPTRKLSEAGRAAIIAATKKRWAAIHESAKSAKKAPPKTKLSPARKAALIANLAKARAARAAKRATA